MLLKRRRWILLLLLQHYVNLLLSPIHKCQSVTLHGYNNKDRKHKHNLVNTALQEQMISQLWLHLFVFGLTKSVIVSLSKITAAINPAD